MTRRAFALLVALPLFPTVRAMADTIHLQDGKTIQNVQIVSEDAKAVVYKEGKSDKTLASDAVAAVEYDKRPKQLDEAEALVLGEDPESAVEAFDAYVEAAIAKPVPAQYRWAPPHAAWRALQVRESVVDVEGVQNAAKRLIQHYPDSRYVPMAFLAKASAELQAGQAARAQETLAELAAVATAQSLPKVWGLECRLAQIQVDPALKPAAKRNEYERVQSEAGDLPALKARAKLLVGEAFLAEAAANQSGARALREEAKEAFQEVLANDKASRSVLAAAYAGLGETLFLQGADANDPKLLQEAVLNLLRVATLYRDEGRTVARALFYAMRSFDLMPDPRRKSEMKRELLSMYARSSWAEEAKKY